MSISEQARELRELSKTFEGKRLGRILGQAADTIESLSAKTADMEHSPEPTVSCGNWCLHWDSINGGCKIHNTIPYGCKDFCSIKMHTMSLSQSITHGKEHRKPYRR